MKLFGFYISRTDWEAKYKIAKSKPCDAKGRFISKKDLMADQFRAEVLKVRLVNLIAKRDKGELFEVGF